MTITAELSTKQWGYMQNSGRFALSILVTLYCWCFYFALCTQNPSLAIEISFMGGAVVEE